MNRLFLFCAALLLQVVLFSCKEEEDTTDTAGNAVGFSVSPISRAAELTEDGLEKAGFYVNAYSTDLTNWSSAKTTATPEFMYSRSVTWDGTNNAWTYSDVKYWPGKVDGSNYGKLSFFAWNKDAESIASVSGNDATGTPTLSVTVPDTQDDQKDLVTGVVIDETSQTVTGGVVPFAFKHVLSRIGFKAKLKEEYPDATVKVTSLKVSYGDKAVKSKGTYTFGDTDHAEGTWALDATYMPNTVSDEVVTADVTLNNDATPTVTRVNGDDRYLMLLPQAVGDGDVVLDVTWTVTATDGAVVTNNQTIELPAQTWVQGWAYDYELVMSLTAVTFGGVTVNPWDDDILFAPCTITYKANGGTGADYVEERITNISYPLWNGNTFTPPTANHIFDRWNTADNGSGEDYWTDEMVMYSADVTLYAQWVAPPVALANCYVVAPGDRVYFPVSRAYVDDGVGSDKLRVDDQNDYTGSFAAEVVWQDVAGLVTPSITLDAGKDSWVRVRTHGSTPGNAVVKIYKANDPNKKAVWSYHIWVTGYDPDQDAGWNPKSNGGTTTRNVSFMDRNLGALEANNSVNGFGFCYQWGRKDPFPLVNGVVGFGIGQGPVTVVEAIQNPGTYYTVQDLVNENDWLIPARDKTLWNTVNNEKSIYDPCPAGWRVPLSGAGTDSPWSGFTDVSRDTGGLIVGSPVQSYWPAAGQRYRQNGSIWSGFFRYWAASVNELNQPLAINDETNATTGITRILNTTNIFSNGLSVRCVRE